MKHVESLRRRVHLKVAAHLNPIPLQPHVIPDINPSQYLLQVRDILHRHNHRKRLPVQDIAERNHITFLDQDRHAAHVQALHHSRAGHFVAAGADAVLALPHHVVVIEVFREVAVDLHVRVGFVLPVVEEDRADRAVDASRVEDEDGALGGGRAAEHAFGGAEWEVDFGDGDVAGWVEVFGGVGVA